MRWQALFLAKGSHEADEYEDAFAGDSSTGRFALADGASESSFAGPWAKALVEAFVAQPLPSGVHWVEWLDPIRRAWMDKTANLSLPWYAEAKAEQGAFATFLGVLVRERSWRVVAIGDTCLFHLRRGKLIKSFPLTRAADFGRSPDLIGSRAPAPAVLQERQHWGRGSWRTGDRLLLMTDALAQWFLKETEAGGQPWCMIDTVLGTPAPEKSFARCMTNLRDALEMRNDDVTALVIDATSEDGANGDES